MWNWPKLFGIRHQSEEVGQFLAEFFISLNVSRSCSDISPSRSETTTILISLLKKYAIKTPTV